jgi:hypothetical protein
MTKADSVHSTPPTNTPEIKPVDPTRRRLLTVAAGGAVAAAIPNAVLSAAQAPAAAQQPATPENATTSETLGLVDRCRRGDRRWTVLANKIDAAEEIAKEKFGRRPFELVAWRNYSAIGDCEIEWARDEFLRADNADQTTVQAEYIETKKRYRDAIRAGEKWDRKAGLSKLRKEYEETRRDTRAAWKALGKVPVKNLKDAAAIMKLLRARARTFNEISDDWEVAAFMNASRFLVRAIV